jgi:bifunctional DNA-binding transcriptional regulator/antitoxin component of YhaV-PrlF toxin-antitoxin module
MPEYLQVRSNGQITLPAQTRRKAKITSAWRLLVTSRQYCIDSGLT